MTQMIKVGHFLTFHLTGERRLGNAYDDHVGEWAVWENGCTVAILPTLEAVQEWAARQHTPEERVLRELVVQHLWDEQDWADADPSEIDAVLAVPATRARFARRAARLAEARRGPY